jgi:hypothetical protein
MNGQFEKFDLGIQSANQKLIEYRWLTKLAVRFVNNLVDSDEGLFES